MTDETKPALPEREAFERAISKPPYERSVSRYPSNERSAWPGNYRRKEARRRALERALLACYELIDKFRKELAELDAGSKA